MATHLLHGLWHREHGLILWIEQVDGHKILTPQLIGDDVFAAPIAEVLAQFRFVHRFPAHLCTPKGRRVQLSIPVARCYPERAVAVLEKLEGALTLESEEQAAAVREQLAPDLLWILHFFRGLKSCVAAGSVVLRVRWADNAWWPQWQLVPRVPEREWIAQMQRSMPEVLPANGSQAVADDITEELPHWIAARALRGFEEQNQALERSRSGEGIHGAARSGSMTWRRPRPLSDFSRALLRSEPLRRGGPSLAGKLNQWKNSIEAGQHELVMILQDPEDLTEHVEDVGEETIFPLRIWVRFGVEAPIPVSRELIDARALASLSQDYHRLLGLSTVLHSPGVERETPEAVADAPSGEWDRYLTVQQVSDFLATDVDLLRSAGFTVMLPASWGNFDVRAELRVKTEDETSPKRIIGTEQLLGYDWHVSLGDTVLTDDEMAALIDSKSGLVELRGSWVMADRRTLSAVRRLVNTVNEYSQLRRAQRARDGEPIKGTSVLTAADVRELALQTEESEPIRFRGDDWLTKLVGGDEDPLPDPVSKEIPDTVHATLRDYQRLGVDWLHWMATHRVGAILADDMGLGKTLQFLTTLAVEVSEGTCTQPSLVVAPTSVLTNWQREAEAFTPSLATVVYHGADRPRGADFHAMVKRVDLVVTSYGMLTRNYQLLSEVRWHHVVLDEAQQIKNARTKVARAAKSLPCEHRIALTGTPIENRLSELHSLMDFCNPGVLGSAQFFRNRFTRAIERYDDRDMKEQLRRLSAPFILRRVKTDPTVIDDLPEKTETVLRVSLTEEQAAMYKAYIDQVERRLREESQGIRRRGIILSAITRIKQICNHPAHFLGDGSSVALDGVHRSGKVAALMDLLDAAEERGEKTLVFTQYRAFGDILRPFISESMGVEVPFLHGGVAKSKRDEMVARFQSPDGPPIMMLSLKAGGTGLNLTAASMVVHLDRWWNPAVENQATDRAYRIGQRKDVQVFKMVSVGTMEEAIHDALEGKLQLARDIVGEGEGWITELSTDDLRTLMDYSRTVEEDESE